MEPRIASTGDGNCISGRDSNCNSGRASSCISWPSRGDSSRPSGGAPPRCWRHNPSICIHPNRDHHTTNYQQRSRPAPNVPPIIPPGTLHRPSAGAQPNGRAHCRYRPSLHSSVRGAGPRSCISWLPKSHRGCSKHAHRGELGYPAAAGFEANAFATADTAVVEGRLCYRRHRWG